MGYILKALHVRLGIHIRDSIERVAEQYPHLVSHFGGHTAAAGLTLKKIILMN